MSKPENKGELANQSSAQINHATIKAKVNQALGGVREQFEAKESEVVDSVLDRVLPSYLSDLERTSPDRIAVLVERKAGEKVGAHLQNFQSQWDTLGDEIVKDAIDSFIPGLLAA